VCPYIEGVNFYLFLDFPSISVQFVKNLPSYYENQPQDINLDESSDEVPIIAVYCAWLMHALYIGDVRYKLKRQQIIERNKAELKRKYDLYFEKVLCIQN